MGLKSVPIIYWDAFYFQFYGELDMRNDMIKRRSASSSKKSLHATGALEKPTDMNKPFVAICNSYIDIVPGHVHLRELADIAKEAIREAGAIPFEFDTIGVDDGIAMGHIGMRYSLPSRNHRRRCRNCN